MKPHSRSRVRAGMLLVSAAAVAIGVGLAAALHDEDQGEPRLVVAGRLYRARQPEGDIAARLRRHGITTVIDLRALDQSADELVDERAACGRAGATFVHIPVSTVVPTDAQTAEFLRTVRSAGGPVLVHCEHGKARTGMMVAAYRIVVGGWSAGRAVREMREYETDTEGRFAEDHVKYVAHVWRNRERFGAQSAPGTGGDCGLVSAGRP